jgi:hypothetical protein
VSGGGSGLNFSPFCGPLEAGEIFEVNNRFLLPLKDKRREAGRRSIALAFLSKGIRSLTTEYLGSGRWFFLNQAILESSLGKFIYPLLLIPAKALGCCVFLS